MKPHALFAPTLACVMALFVFLLLWEASGQTTADEWFNLAVTIQNHDHQLDPDERRFVKNVVNRLAVSPDSVPTPEHKKWLLSIKQRLELK
jgi:hypothetical protein